MRGEVAAVSCPNCGAGLKVLGGGRVVLQVCTHCGSALDAVENYRLLKTFAGQKRPDTPFRLGQTGRIQGVDWTVIGILGWAETDRGQSWNWTDHQLYAPTHGYAWLTLEDGHLILSRAFRGALSPPWFTAQGVETSESRPTIRARGESFAYYETSDAKITYAEGEFSWMAMVGDRVSTLVFLSDDGMLTLTESDREREVELSTYLPQAETWAAFGLPAPGTSWRVHPLQSYRPWRNELFLGGLGTLTALSALVLGIFLSASGEEIKPVLQPAPSRLSIEADLPITQTQGLAELHLFTDLSDAWAGVEVELTDPKGQPLFQTAREIGYYTGVEDGESWSEGSNEMVVAFHPTEPGTYGLSIDVPEGGRGEGSGGAPIFRMNLRVYQGEPAAFWMWLVFFAALPVALVTPLRVWLHGKARWRGSDWSDD